MSSPPRSICVSLCLITTLLMLPCPSEAGKREKGLFSARDAGKHEKKLQTKLNPNDSGAGLLKVEIAMVKYYAKIKKKAKKGTARTSEKEEKKAEKLAKKNIVRRLRRIAEIKRLRAATTFRGLWEFDILIGSTVYDTAFLHFSNVNEETDAVSGSVENPADNPVRSFSGFERLDAVRITTDTGDEYYLIINGNSLSGLVRSPAAGGDYGISGTRVRGP